MQGAAYGSRAEAVIFRVWGAAPCKFVDHCKRNRGLCSSNTPHQILSMIRFFSLWSPLMSGFRCDGCWRAINRINMDRLSVATSVAGVAAMGVQLSQTIYGLISTFYEAEKEMSIVANDLSLLAMVLNELEGILRRDSRVYRRRMVREVNEILNSCEGVFQSIFHHVSANPHDARSSRQFKAKVRWYFQRHRVRPLQAGLESMKSTLNVLLHVVHMARVIEAAEFYM